MIYADDAELQAGLAKWRKILRLQDWDLFAELVSAADMDGATGKCYALPTKQCARISMLRREDFRDPCRDRGVAIGDGDMERVLVHELIHAHMRLMYPDDWETLEGNIQERFVETMAQCFVALDRRDRPGSL